MPKRDSVPPMRPRDVLLSPAEPASAPLAPANVKTSAYLRPEQLTRLDELRAAHRASGRRWVTGSDLIRAALILAEQHGEEWEQLVAGEQR